jgi:hypothetical protein
MHGLISYLLWDTLFIPFLIILVFLGDQGRCLRWRGCGLRSVTASMLTADPEAREARRAGG